MQGESSFAFGVRWIPFTLRVAFQQTCDSRSVAGKVRHLSPGCRQWLCLLYPLDLKLLLVHFPSIIFSDGFSLLTRPAAHTICWWHIPGRQSHSQSCLWPFQLTACSKSSPELQNQKNADAGRYESSWGQVKICGLNAYLRYLSLHVNKATTVLCVFLRCINTASLCLTEEHCMS